jgi:serine/threonine protein kinase
LSISLGKGLGEGSFGTVYEGVFEGKPTCAVKMAQNSDESRKALLNEDFMLRYLHHNKEDSVSHIIRRDCLLPLDFMIFQG